MSLMTAFDLAAKFAVGGLEIVEVLDTSLEKAAVVVETRAKKIIGHYQTDTGPYMAWQLLAASTLEDKLALGFAPPDNPLLREGILRDAIEHYTEDMKAVVGVPDEMVLHSYSDQEVSIGDIAMWQELGTENIPPRSFLGVAAFQKQDKVAELIGDAVFTMLIDL